MGKVTAVPNTLAEGFFEITSCHDLGIVVRQEGMRYFGDFEDETSKRGTVLQLFKKFLL
jgi:hypothetical protein